MSDHDKTLTMPQGHRLAARRGVPVDFSPAMTTIRFTPPLALLLALALFSAAAHAGRAPAEPAPAAEQPAIDAVLEAFEHADIVTLGERPWSRLDSDFRHQLVADPRFGRRVDDIVVEFANARFQPLLDRYLLELQNLPADSLRPIWQEASEPGAWDSPVYAYLIETVRRANRPLPPEQRIRVLAGEPPIDWSRVESAADLDAWGSRGAHALEVIEREVIAKGRKALLVYSARNFFRRDRAVRAYGNLTTNLEARHPDLRVFVIGTVPERSPARAALDSTLTLGVRPVLVRLAGSKIGAWATARIFEYGEGVLAEMADALVYYGPADDRFVRPSDRVVRDPEYAKEVARRKARISR